MSEDLADEEIIVRRRRRRRLRLALWALLLILLAALAVVWLMRVRLASDYIDDELARRGVSATYDVRRIGIGKQVFENLVIGDPNRPDATARRVEIHIGFGLTGPAITLIRARGVRLFGRLENGRLSFGEIDRLLPPPSGLPFRLPHRRVDVADTAIAITTPAGLVGLGLEGRGNLADGFDGELALVSRELRLGECRLARPRGRFAVRVDDLRPHLRGPLAIGSLGCGSGFRVAPAALALDATLAPALDSWRGRAALRAPRIMLGSRSLAGVAGRLTFAGDASRTAGEVGIGARSVAADALRAGPTRFDGNYALSLRRGDLQLAGGVEATGLRLSEPDLRSLAGALRSARGTPLGPAGELVAAAFERASRGGGAARARLELARRGSRGALRLSGLDYRSASGLRLAASDGAGLSYRWPAGGLGLDGTLVTAGGGFPETRLALRQARPGAPIEGVARIAPISAGGSRLALDEVRFAMAGAQTRFSTRLAIDGPFAGGRVAGLVVPIEGRFAGGALAIGERCTPLSFQALQVEGLRLGPARLALCPAGPAIVSQPRGGAFRVAGTIARPRLAGRLGGSPIALEAGRLGFTGLGFEAAGLRARLGRQRGEHRLEIASLRGRFAAGGAAGAYAGLAGSLSGVPLLLSEGRGEWRILRGRLRMAGALRVADAAAPARFHPLETRDFTLTLVANRIEAGGLLVHPASGTAVADAAVRHDLTSGGGTALLEMRGIRFGPDFQPDALTPLTTGIVALVDGTLTGTGRIAWGPRGVTSSGEFATEGMNLAAPFGPVEGLTTRIHFTDLLGLASAPGQVARIDGVRAGIDVFEGEIAYQLLPGLRVAIEGGSWPFAGGTLRLQPTLLDFSRPTTKYLTFEVAGLDAARLVEQLEFANIAATGTFDGIIPMRFDQSGGSIAGGRLTARPEGGTLSYIGEITDRDLGVYGKMAFDALKALRYNRFDVRLDGSLAGEFLTHIDLDGIAREVSAAPALAGGGLRGLLARRALGQLARIPFEFNIRIRGPFRALIGTARSFDDPTLLIEGVLPRILRQTPTSVQQEVSEDERQ